jgi:hypothetical protein
MSKRCKTCLIVKEYSFFPKHKDCRNGVSGKCKLCENDRKRPLINKTKRKNYKYKGRYNLTTTDVQEMMNKQEDTCGICKKTISLGDIGEKATANVDHCESPWRIRGMLCSYCNVGIGLLKHDIKALEAAILWIKYAHKGSIVCTDSHTDPSTS